MKLLKCDQFPNLMVLGGKTQTQFVDGFATVDDKTARDLTSREGLGLQIVKSAGKPEDTAPQGAEPVNPAPTNPDEPGDEESAEDLAGETEAEPVVPVVKPASNAGVNAWQAYAESLGITIPDGAAKAEIRELVAARESAGE